MSSITLRILANYVSVLSEFKCLHEHLTILVQQTMVLNTGVNEEGNMELKGDEEKFKVDKDEKEL